MTVRKKSSLVALAFLIPLHALPAQDFDTRVKTSTPTDSPALAAANAALAAHDYDRALTLLTPLAAASPKDAHLLYNLASAQDALDQTSAAERSYRAAIAADPTFPEPHVALGLLLARAARFPEARAELAAAAALPAIDAPLKARTLRTLARIDSSNHPDQTSRPADARDELLAALKLSPETPEDTLLAAELAAASNSGAPAAEAAYRRLLAARPNDPEASAGLARLLIQQKRAAEAITLLTEALAARPSDPALTVQLASAYRAEGRDAEALPLVLALHAATPQDPNITRVLAGLYLQRADYAAAEPLLAALTTANPQDTQAADDRARALIHLHRPAEAQAVLTPLVAQPALFPSPAALADAAGDLAFAASENNDPAACLRALDVRATVLPTSAPVLFLFAISHDKLHHVKLALEAYQSFLAASKGANADEEFEARHRIIALQHMK